jgi:hypothetical protein
MRANGRRSLSVTCEVCQHEAAKSDMMLPHKVKAGDNDG